jgi:putative membrane protein
MKYLKHMVAACLAVATIACNDSANEASNNDGEEMRNDTSTTTGTTAVAEKDAQFVMDVAASNMAEIKMAQLAQQKGNNQEVKDLGKMLETDHSAVLSEITNYAGQKGVTVPSEEKPEAKEAHNTLNGKTGKEFDKEWCGHMIEMHKKSISKFEGAQNELADADLKTWAGNTLPKLRTHLEKLEQCNNKLK